MSVRKIGPGTTPVDLIVDANEYAELRDENKRLRAAERQTRDAEVGALRKALETIHINAKGLADGMVPSMGQDAISYFQNIEAIARAALAAVEGRPVESPT